MNKSYQFSRIWFYCFTWGVREESSKYLNPGEGLGAGAGQQKATSMELSEDKIKAASRAKTQGSNIE